MFTSTIGLHLNRCLVLFKSSKVLKQSFFQLQPSFELCLLTLFWRVQFIKRKKKQRTVSFLSQKYFINIVHVHFRPNIHYNNDYKALLQWAFVEIWTQFQIVPETDKKQNKKHSYNTEQKLFPKICACCFCRCRNETLFFSCMHS